MGEQEQTMTFATGRFGARRGFTLLELCLVLAMLSVAAALIAPALAHFVGGRSLDAEARRMLSLAHAAQCRAVSQGIPVLLWFDAAAATYGMEAEATRTETADSHAEEFALGDRMTLTVVNPTLSTTQKKHLPAIRFLPDGGIDESSPETVQLRDAFGAALSMKQTRNRMSYEISHAD